MTHLERFLAAVRGEAVDRIPVFPLLPLMAQSGADLYNVDHLVPLAQAKAAYVAAGKCFKGNLDPVAHLMQATPDECEAHALRCLAEAAGARYMLSAGCEIPAAVSDEVFARFCAAPQRFADERAPAPLSCRRPYTEPRGTP